MKRNDLHYEPKNIAYESKNNFRHYKSEKKFSSSKMLEQYYKISNHDRVQAIESMVLHGQNAQTKRNEFKLKSEANLKI